MNVAQQLFSQTSKIQSSMLENWQIVSIKENPEWIPYLNKYLENIVISKKDRNALNYSKKRFNMEEQIDIHLIVVNKKILAFSSIWKASHFPPHFARVLNRFYKDPSLRRNRLFSKKIRHQSFRIMVYHQIQRALEDKNIHYIFISMEGNSQKVLEKLICEYNKVYSGWKIHPHFVQVCDGPYNKCWQSFAYLHLQNKAFTHFPFKFMTQKEWLSKVKSERRCS